MKNLWSKKQQLKAFAASGVVAVATFASSAHAALDEAVETALTTAFAGLVADATELQALVMTPIIGILAVSLVVKLVKRFGNKI